MSYRHFAGETSKADRQDLIDRINNTARNEFLHPVSGVRKSLFVHRGRHAKPSRIVSPTRSIVALTLVVSSLCVTPAANADAVKSVVESKTASAYDSHSALDDSGKADVEVTTFDSDVAGRSPELGDISSESSSSLRPQSLLKVPQTEVDASPTAVVPASGTWGTCRWDIDSDGVLTIHAGTGADSVSTTGAPWYKWASDITAVRSDGTVFMPSTAVGLFYGCVNLTDISGLSKFDTSRLSNAHSMFRDCQKLTDLSPLSGWDMRSVEITAYMFTNVIELKSLSGLESWGMSKVGTVQGMFQGCNSLTDISAIKTWGLGSSGKLKILSWMFQDCWKLSDLGPLSNVDTGNATDFRGMFQNCVSITSTAPLSAWNTSNVTMMGWMFFIESGTQSSIGKSSLTDISGLASWNVSKVTNFQSMFDTCSMLEDFSPLSSWRPDSAEIMGWMFTRCSKMRNLDFMSGWNITRIREMNAMFQGCSQLQDIRPLQRWNVSRVQEMKWLFYGCHSLSSIEPLGAWKTDRLNNLYRTFAECRSLTDLSPLSGWNVSNVTDMSWTFHDCRNVSDLTPLSNWNTSNVKSLDYTFYQDSSITSLQPLASWNTGNVSTMKGTFRGDSSLVSLKGLEKWDTSNVVYMGDPNEAPHGTFAECSKLSDISAVSGWNTGKVTIMRDLFNGCTSLQDINALAQWNTASLVRIDGAFMSTGISNVNGLSKWNTSKVNDMTATFHNCRSLSDISGLTEWNTSSLVRAYNLFYRNSSLKSIDALNNWDMSKVTGMSNMFYSCTSLEDTSAISHWDLSSVKDSASSTVFRDCPRLELVGVPTVDHNGAWLLSKYLESTGTKGWTAYDWAPVNRNLAASQVQAGYTGANSTITDVRVWRLGVKYWGTCPWWVDDEGILHINDVPGEGNGADTDSEQQVPWYSVRSKVKKIATQDAVHMPNKSSYLFCQMTNLTDVSGLSRWDSSKTSDFVYLFYGAKALTDLTPITSWNVSSVTRMSASFSWMDSLQSLEPLKNWNVSSLIIADHLFQGCQSVTDLEPLSNWDVSNVTNMRCLFEGCTGLKNLHGLENWDVRKVTDMGAFLSMYAWGSNGPTAYSRPTQLTDISALANWKTSSLDFASSFMAGCSKLTDIDALKNLDISKVDDLGNMFYKCTSLEDTSAIANWDASKVVKTGGMFIGDGALTRIGVPAVGKGAEKISKAYPNRNWTDEGLPITPLKNSNGIYPYMTSNTEGRDFTDNGGVFIPYQPVYIVTFDDNGATKPGVLPDRQWAYVNPTGGQRGDVNLPVGYKGLRTGYHFAGWSTTPDASSGVISPDDATWRPSGGLSTGDPSKIVLYAVWEANTTSELPSTGSRGLIELVLGFFGTVGLVVVTGRTRRPRHAR